MTEKARGVKGDTEYRWLGDDHLEESIKDELFVVDYPTLRRIRRALEYQTQYMQILYLVMMVYMGWVVGTALA